MPATSKAQQKFFGIVRSIQKGDAKSSEFSKDAQDAAKRISKSDVKKYAKTKHSGLPKKVKMEILRKLKEASDGWASPPFSHMDSKKRKHDDDNNLGKKKKHSGQPDLEEGKFSKKPEVTSQQLSKIQSDVRKINRKIKVYISKHPITKGELSIELGAGHDNDSEIDKIYKVLKKHTGTHRTGTMFNEGVLSTPKSQLTYQLAIDYSGNTKPKITKLNKRFIQIMYGYKVNPKDVIKSLNKIVPDSKFKHMGWSSKSTGGGFHKFSIKESIAPNHDGKAAPYGSGYEKVEEDGKEISDKNYDAWKKDNKLKEWLSPNLTEDKINELGIFPISSYLKGMIPRKYMDTTTPKKKERFRAVVRDLISTLNQYWKQHKIPYRVKEGIEEETKRDYKKEYKKFQSSKKAKKYRAELNKYNRDKGTYGNGDGKDASHKGGKIVGFESASKNRGRAEKSRLKKNK